MTRNSFEYPQYERILGIPLWFEINATLIYRENWDIVLIRTGLCSKCQVINCVRANHFFSKKNKYYKPHFSIFSLAAPCGIQFLVFSAGVDLIFNDSSAETRPAISWCTPIIDNINTRMNDIKYFYSCNCVAWAIPICFETDTGRSVVRTAGNRGLHVIL